MVILVAFYPALKYVCGVVTMVTCSAASFNVAERCMSNNIGSRGQYRRIVVRNEIELDDDFEVSKVTFHNVVKFRRIPNLEHIDTL